MARTVLVAGVGPGLGSAVARRFAEGGDDVALLARSGEYLRSVATDVERSTPGRAVAVPADVTDAAAVSAAFETARDEFGPVDALVDCVYSDRTASGGVLDVDFEEFRGAWTVEAGGAFRCAREAARDMVAGDGGTVVFTNSTLSRRAGTGRVARSSARFALRGLAEALARDLHDEGVQVVHAVVDGWIDKPALREAHPDRPEAAWLDPDRIAETYWHLVEQDDRAATFEVDLRTLADDLGT